MASPARHAVLRRSNSRTPGQEFDSPLPPMKERLAYLRPSRELLEFYRQKIAQFDGEHEELLEMLERYRGITEDQHKLQWEVQQREGEIAELQSALSDMQVFLFQEREQSLRLYAENDRLKIRELEDRRKIQHLLTLDTAEITYFHKDPPHKVVLPQKIPESSLQETLSLRPTNLRPGTRKESSGRTKSADGVNGESLEQCKKDNQTLLLQVEALHAQMEEQTRLAKEQVESLLEDRRIHKEEGQVQRQRDQERIAALTDKLKHTQNLLYESTKDFLQLKFDTRAVKKSWMVEKDGLLKELDSFHDHMRWTRSGCDELDQGRQPSRAAKPLFRPQPDALQTHKEEDLKQAHRLAEMYREQCIALESELAQVREEQDMSRKIFKERSDKMAKRQQLMTRQHEALEKRRALEVEGFKTDLKLLRQKLKDVEKQFFKVNWCVEPNPDLAVLQEVRQTNTRTKKIQGELMALKAKIYGLENELRCS